MIDVRHLLSALTQLIGEADFPDPSRLGAALDLDLRRATVTKTKQRNLGIVDASLDGTNVNIACGFNPKREIWLIFDHSPISYEDIKSETFGANQRIQPSKHCKGFAVLFDIHGLTCGYTTDSQVSSVDALFCEEPVSAASVIM